MSKNFCPICEGNVEYRFKTNSYLAKGKYFINECSNCELQFVDSSTEISNSINIYDSIYKNISNVVGYNNYLDLANDLSKAVDNRESIKILNKLSDKYAFLIEEIQKEVDSRILEIGCGLGYLTFYLNKIGYNCTGYDVSNAAIKTAKSLFGSYYIDDLKELKSKYDFIVLTETIEHLDYPVSTLVNLKQYLNSDGVILLTTPRKYDSQKRSKWITQSPPIHRFWFTKKSILLLSNKLGMDVKFVKENSNKLFLYVRKAKVSLSRFDVSGNPSIDNKSLVNRSKFFNKLPIIIKFIYYYFTRRQPVLTRTPRTIYFKLVKKS